MPMRRCSASGIAAVGRGAGRVDALDARPVFVAAPVQGEAFALKLLRLAVERRPDGLGRDELRHGAVGTRRASFCARWRGSRGTSPSRRIRRRRAGRAGVAAKGGCTWPSAWPGGGGPVGLRRVEEVDGKQDGGDNRQGNHPPESGGVNFWIVAVHVARPR